MRTFGKLALVVLLVAACGMVPKLPGQFGKWQLDITKFKRGDLTKAIGLAHVATDPGAKYRERCYTTLLRYVPETPPAAPVKPGEDGIATLYELAAEADYKARSSNLVPPDVEADCGYIRAELEAFAVRMGIMGAGAIR